MSMSAAAAAFEEALVELGFDEDDPAVGDVRSFGRRAALLVAADTVWGRHLGPMLSTKQVIQLLRVTTRQAVNDRVRRHRLLALPGHDRELDYPAFQFRANGEPYPGVPAVLKAFSTAGISPPTIASWFVTPQPDLDGVTPVEWMAAARDDNELAHAAQRSAQRLAR